MPTEDAGDDGNGIGNGTGNEYDFLAEGEALALTADDSSLDNRLDDGDGDSAVATASPALPKTGAGAHESEAGSTTWAIVITGEPAALALITGLPSTGGLGDRPGAGPTTWVLLVTVIAAGLGVVAVWPHHARRNR